jgi:uncharacterized cupredoxin-like copper-binding protein
MPRMKFQVGLALGAFVALSAVAPLALGSSHAGTTTTVSVKASEFKFVLSRKTAPHGTVVFKVVNKGHVAHDFKIAGKKTVKLKPGKSAILKVTLKKGTYRYICTVDAHAVAGMKGTFKVS